MLQKSNGCVLIDNGLLRAIAAKEADQKLINWFSDTFTHPESKLQGKQFRYFASASALLEAVGQKPPKLAAFDFTKEHVARVKAKKIEEIRLEMWNDAMARLQTFPELSTDEIRTKLHKQKTEFSSAGGAILLDAIFQDASNIDQLGESICKRLSFDQLYKQTYPKEISNQMELASLVDVLRAPTLGWDLSQARVVKKTFAKLRPKLIKDKTFSKEKIARLDKSLGFDNTTDLLDMEVIQFSVTGRLQENEMIPIYVYTAEDRQSLVDRIAVFKSVLTIVTDYLDQLSDEDREKMNWQPLPFAPGKIFICSHETGKIIDFIDVSTVPTLDGIS